jgi:hypothetical protein
MKYEKPEIALIGSAVEAVQNSMIKQSPQTDNHLETTVAAYQSDEK